MNSVADQLRDLDPAQFFATLFIPADHRDAVMALRCFVAEIARIPWLVSEPMLGEIRLQWWREVLDGAREGEAAANPLASALMQAVRHYRLPVQALQGLIDARGEDLYADPPPSLHDLEGRLGECFSVPYRLAALICHQDASRGVADVAGHGGVAEGLVDLLARWPVLLRRSRVMLPQDVMKRFDLTREIVLAGTAPERVAQAFQALCDEAARHRALASAALGALDPQEAVAFLPLCLVEPHLKRLQRGLPTEPVTLPQWRMQFDLWRASQRAVTRLF